ncbi:hypothetical protein evm_004908 [Chilo suppressalis]|nr:hypothetical protein evm_004908 [Chilo suppressalis]
MQSESQKPMDFDKSRSNKMITESQSTCYCGKDRNLNIAELLCASCNRWFHESCIGYQLGKLVPFMTNYLFICKNCSPTGLETFKKNQAPFPQMCLTAIANLRQESVKDGSNKLLFSKDREIIPYIDQYWEAMTTMPRRVTQSWYATVQRALIKDIQVLFTYEEDPSVGPMFGLFNMELTSIKPNYEAMIKQGQLKVTDMGIATVPLAGNVKGRQGKRRPAVGGATDAGAPVGKKGRAADLSALKLPSHGYPTEHPFNKDGYRYILAEPDPHAPFRQKGKTADLSALKLPSHGYPTEHPFNKDGYRFHESRGKHYSSGYGEGDTLGFLIVLPSSTNTKYTPNTYKDRPLVKFKSHLYYEDKDNIQESLNTLKPLPGSKIYYFKNGECQGEAFIDIFQGCYYPSVSLHKNVTVSVNFGPNFKYAPSSEYNYRPMSEKAEEAICEQTMADLLYLTENEGKLRLDNFNL